jgi:hypothetical protein
MPVPPAYTPTPLSFHSDPAKFGYILYQGKNCDREGWGAICHDEVRLLISVPSMKLCAVY